MNRAIILNGEMNTASGIAGASRNDADEAPFAQKTKRLLRQRRSARPWLAAAMLAMIWTSETQGFPDQAQHRTDAQRAMAARNFDPDRPARCDDFKALLPSSGSNNKSVQVAQATTRDPGRPPEREQNWAETLLFELTIARRDIELLQRLTQEHDRAQGLEQALAAARRDVETHTARAEKAYEQASRLKQAEESGTAELQTSLQQERERSARLELDLAAARRDVEVQTALAVRAAEEVLQWKQAAEAGAGELRQSMQKERERADALAHDLSTTRSALQASEAQARRAGDEAAKLIEATANDAPSLCQSAQDEHDRSVRLEQDLAAARREAETQTGLAAKASEDASRLKQASGSSEAELQKSLQQERERFARLEQDLAVARRDVETQTALATKASEEAFRLKQASENSRAELQKSVQQGLERSARLEQDLAAARREAETQAALAAKASEEASRLKQASESGGAELQKSLRQGLERSALLEQDLAAARREAEIQTALAAKASEDASRLKQASGSSEAELQKSLQQERERFARLEQELAAARREVETQTALAAKAAEEVLRAKRAAETGAAELRQSMQKERERADALAESLSMTRSALYAFEARTLKLEEEAVELRQAAAAPDGRDRAKWLEQDLGTARRDLDVQAALTARASEEAARTRKAAERDLASLRSSLQQERARAEQLERDLAFARQVAPNAVTVGSIARDKRAEDAKSVADGPPAASVGSDAQANSNKAAAAAPLLARASALLAQGNIGAARIVLERAVEMGSLQASFSLAETYDPLTLAKWGTLGTRGDAARAQDLYAKADAAGIKEAKARIEALRR